MVDFIKIYSPEVSVLRSVDLYDVREHWLCRTQLAPQPEACESVQGMCGLLVYRLRLAHVRQPRTWYPVTETCDRLKRRGSEASLCLRKESQPVRNSETFSRPFPVTCRWGNPSKLERQRNIVSVVVNIDAQVFRDSSEGSFSEDSFQFWGDDLTNREWSGNKRAEREERHEEERAISRFSVIDVWLYCSRIFSLCSLSIYSRLQGRR